MARNLKALELTAAVRNLVYSKAATSLASLGLVYVEQGSQGHIAAGLAVQLPLVEAMHVKSTAKFDRALSAYHCEHTILLAFYRAIGNLERERVSVLGDAQKIFDVFAQDVGQFPTWSDPAVLIDECHPISLEVSDKFEADSVQIEEALIEIWIKATHYNV